MQVNSIQSRVNIRAFSRSMYSHTQHLPLEVYNKKTGKTVFVVISPKEGSDVYAVETNNTIQSNK